MTPLALGDITIGAGSPFVLVAGPCVIESEQHATDLAGRLSSGEVGILLLETPPPGAQVVARRLARVFETRPHGSEPAVRIGVASQNGDEPSAAELIERARSHVLAL